MGLRDLAAKYESFTDTRSSRLTSTADEQPLRCIKLLLDQNQKLPSWVNDLETSAALLRHDRLAKDAVADFLAKIAGHIKAHLSLRYPANFLKGITYQYVLTVPAVWSDVAREATLSAAKHAGMGPNITMVSGQYCKSLCSFDSFANVVGQSPKPQHTTL